MHSSVVHVRAQTVPPMFLVIAEEMFSTCLYSDALDAHNGFVGAFSIEIGIGTKAGFGIIYHYQGQGRAVHLSHPLPAFGLRIFFQKKKTLILGCLFL